jgi:hypothetical protein
MRGRTCLSKEEKNAAASSFDPSSVSFADTFSHKGRRILDQAWPTVSNMQAAMASSGVLAPCSRKSKAG